MNQEQKYLEDLSEIRKVMDRSTRFLSLTGWSGIMAGLYALIGAYIAYQQFYYNSDEVIYNTLSQQSISGNVAELFVLALAVLFLAIGTAIFLAHRKAAKSGIKLWNSAARRLVINLAIPLFAGGIFAIILFLKGILPLITPVTLIFYGLALINASKYTFNEARQLGLLELILGLVSAYYTGFGLLFWALGFGVLHIIYGILMHYKYER